MRHLQSASTDPFDGITMEADPEVGTSIGGDDPADAETDDDDGDDEDTDDDDGDDEDDEKLGEKGVKALKRERAARKEAEKRLKQLERDQEDDAEKKLREATEAVESRYHGLIAKAAFKASLAQAGLRKGEDKLLRLLELEDVEVDEDGDVTGVDEQVRNLKREFPELFARDKQAAGKGDGGAKGAPKEKQLSMEERLVAGSRSRR